MYEKFEEVLNALNLSPYKVAKATGISQSTLSDWKMGKSSPKGDKLQKIADTYGINVEFLLGKDVPMKKEDLELLPKIGSDDFLLVKKFHQLNSANQSVLLSTLEALSNAQGN